jgi:alkaline phosphatase
MLSGCRYRRALIALLLPSLVLPGCYTAAGDPGGPADAGPGDGGPDAGVPDSACNTDHLRGVEPALPRNLILFMGDGMGSAHIEAARLVKQGPLRLDALDGPVLYQTDSLSRDQVAGEATPPDSASSMTAAATGVLVENGVLSIGPRDEALETVLELAMAEGKSAGLVTNSIVTDASPMAWAVHIPDRDLHREIATELLSETRPEVILGGWTPYFEDNEAELLQLAVSAGYEVAHGAGELSALSSLAPRRTLGLFRVTSPGEVWPAWEYGLTPVALRQPGSDEPTLVEMTRYALERLSGDADGFFLFVENHHIDRIGHLAVDFPDQSARNLPAEVLELDQALGAALDWVELHSSLEHSLVLLFSDHETGGYTLQGEDPSRAVFLDSPYHTTRTVPLYAAGPGAEGIESVSHVSHIYWLLTGRLPADGETICR